VITKPDGSCTLPVIAPVPGACARSMLAVRINATS
jgi:hypothetical protein